MDLVKLMGQGLVMGPDGVRQTKIVPYRTTTRLGCTNNLIMNLFLFSLLPETEEEGIGTHVVMVGVSQSQKGTPQPRVNSRLVEDGVQFISMVQNGMVAKEEVCLHLLVGN